MLGMFDSSPPMIDMLSALSEASLLVLALLLPVLVMRALVRHYVFMKEFGISRMASSDLGSVKSAHPLLHALGQATTALTLVFAGLVVQIGYTAAVHGGLLLEIR